MTMNMMFAFQILHIHIVPPEGTYDGDVHLGLHFLLTRFGVICKLGLQIGFLCEHGALRKDFLILQLYWWLFISTKQL